MGRHAVNIAVSKQSCPSAHPKRSDSLEVVEFVLPSPVQLEPHLHTPEDHLLASLEVDAELNNIPIIHRVRLALLRRRTKPYVVEKRAGAALDVLDVPFSILVPELAVPSADHLALKPDGGCRGLVSGDVAHGLAISLGVASDTDGFCAGWERSRDRGKGEGGAVRAGVEVGREAY